MYDTAKRRRIRTALINYMQAHRIGTPALAKRISTGNAKGISVVLKTLQRFLTDQTRVNDAAVEAYADFVRKLPGRPYDLLGLADMMDTLFNPRAVDLPPSYVLTNTEDFHSIVTVKSSGPAFVITETTHTPYRRFFDGVLLFTNRCAVAVLKDRLMSSPRFHMMHPQEDDSFDVLIYDPDPFNNGHFILHTVKWIPNANN